MAPNRRQAIAFQLGTLLHIYASLSFDELNGLYHMPHNFFFCWNIVAYSENFSWQRIWYSLQCFLLTFYAGSCVDGNHNVKQRSQYSVRRFKEEVICALMLHVTVQMSPSGTFTDDRFGENLGVDDSKCHTKQTKLIIIVVIFLFLTIHIRVIIFQNVCFSGTNNYPSCTKYRTLRHYLFFFSVPLALFTCDIYDSL